VRDKYFGSHEFRERVDVVAKSSSDRSFGLVMTAFAALLAMLGVWHGSARWPFWLGVTVVMLVLALAAPKLLAPFNRVWTKFGLLLHAIVSPMILATIFYGCIAPVGLLMRLSGNDPLHLRYNADADTYWINRNPPGPQPDTFRNQF
jgi:hypothetical protein